MASLFLSPQALDKLGPSAGSDVAERSGGESTSESDYFEQHAWKLNVNYLNDPFPRWPPAELFKLAGFPGL